MGFEEFSEDGKVRKLQRVDYFFNRRLRMTKPVFYFSDGRFVYPLCGCLATCFLHYAAQVFGSDT